MAETTKTPLYVEDLIAILEEDRTRPTGLREHLNGPDGRLVDAAHCRVEAMRWDGYDDDNDASYASDLAVGYVVLLARLKELLGRRKGPAEG